MAEACLLACRKRLPKPREYQGFIGTNLPLGSIRQRFWVQDGYDSGRRLYLISRALDLWNITGAMQRDLWNLNYFCSLLVCLGCVSGQPMCVWQRIVCFVRGDCTKRNKLWMFGIPEQPFSKNHLRPSRSTRQQKKRHSDECRQNAGKPPSEPNLQAWQTRV